MKITFLLTIVLVSIVSPTWSSMSASERALLPTGVKILNNASIYKPDDIESAVIYLDKVYKITWESDKDQIIRLYKCLHALKPTLDKPDPCEGGMLAVTNKRGRTISCGIEGRRAKGGMGADYYYLALYYESRELAKLMKDIEKNTAAVTRDSRMPPIKVASLEAFFKDKSTSVPLSSTEGTEIYETIKSLLNQMDLRCTRIEWINPDDILKYNPLYASAGFHMVLKDPIDIKVRSWKGYPCGHMDDPIFGDNMSFEQIDVDRISITAYGQSGFDLSFRDKRYLKNTYSQPIPFEMKRPDGKKRSMEEVVEMIKRLVVGTNNRN